MATYGQAIEWNDFDGTFTRISTSDHTTPESAREAALRMATDMGWTPPKWWQWWRWEDTRIAASGKQEGP